MGKVTFLHLDLGIGGAERLVVDAALALKGKGHHVSILTTHHDKNRAFRETVNGEIPVMVVGDWIPRSFFNRFYALLAYLRMIYAAFYLITFGNFHSDVIFCDIVSVAVPVLKLGCRNVVFYCHFPDQLLSRPEGKLKALYRAPLDWLEEFSVGKATKIFVNSKFTAAVCKKTFKNLTQELEVVYPSLNMSFFDSAPQTDLPAALEGFIHQDTICFLSINRYERKKNLNLVLEALNELRASITADDWEKVHLVLAGGYDLRVNENVEHLEELKILARELDLCEKVNFLTSVSDLEKVAMIKACTCLVYTPSNEHFGIVPIEAMYLGKPVIAVNCGGPVETIEDGVTGFLRESNPSAFADAMKKFVVDKNLTQVLGTAGRERVSLMFSFEGFAKKLDSTVRELLRLSQS